MNLVTTSASANEIGVFGWSTCSRLSAALRISLAALAILWYASPEALCQFSLQSGNPHYQGWIETIDDQLPPLMKERLDKPFTIHFIDGNPDENLKNSDEII